MDELISKVEDYDYRNDPINTKPIDNPRLGVRTYEDCNGKIIPHTDPDLQWVKQISPIMIRHSRGNKLRSGKIYSALTKYAPHLIPHARAGVGDADKPKKAILLEISRRLCRMFAPGISMVQIDDVSIEVSRKIKKSRKVKFGSYSARYFLFSNNNIGGAI